MNLQGREKIDEDHVMAIRGNKYWSQTKRESAELWRRVIKWDKEKRKILRKREKLWRREREKKKQTNA